MRATSGQKKESDSKKQHSRIAATFGVFVSQIVQQAEANMNLTPRFKSWVVVVILGVISSAVWDAIKAATAIPHYISFHPSFLRVVDVAYSIALASFAFILGSRRANDALSLPPFRPKIVPVRWGRTPDNRCGLFIRNDGGVTLVLRAQHDLRNASIAT